MKTIHGLPKPLGNFLAGLKQPARKRLIAACREDFAPGGSMHGVQHLDLDKCRKETDKIRRRLRKKAVKPATRRARQKRNFFQDVE